MLGEETTELVLNYNTNNIEEPNVVVISEMVDISYDGAGFEYAEWNKQIEIIE